MVMGRSLRKLALGAAALIFIFGYLGRGQVVTVENNIGGAIRRARSNERAGNQTCAGLVLDSQFSNLLETQLSSSAESVVDVQIKGLQDCCVKCDRDELCGGFTFDDRQTVCRYMAKGAATATMCPNCTTYVKANGGGALIQLSVPPEQHTAWVAVPGGLKAVQIDGKAAQHEAAPQPPLAPAGAIPAGEAVFPPPTPPPPPITVAPQSPASASGQCQVNSRHDIVGGDISTVQVATAEQCCEACNNVGHCVVAAFCGHREATYKPGQPVACFLKSAHVTSTTPVPAPKCDLLVARPDLLIDFSSPSAPQPSLPTATVSEVQQSAIKSIWTGPPVKFIVAVLSARGNIERRQNIRNLWLHNFEQEADARGEPSRVFFVVGNNFCRYSHKPGSSFCGDGNRQSPNSPQEAAEDKDLWEEQRVHGDLMFIDVNDNYQNSAAKMLGLYRQLAEAGREYFCVVKLDDDAIILPKRFFDVMDLPITDVDGKLMPNNQDGKPSTVHGHLAAKGPRWMGNFRPADPVHREANNKWGVDKSVYDRSFWPAYAGGPAHVLNRAFAQFIGENAALLSTSQTPGDGLSHAGRHVWMEDVAHGLWFEKAAAAFATEDSGKNPACRLWDHRFPTFVNECLRDAITLGSVWTRDGINIMLDVYKTIDEAMALPQEQREAFYDDKLRGRRLGYADQPKSFAATLTMCKGTGPPSWGIGEKSPTVKVGLGQFNKPVIFAMQEVMKPNEQVEFPIEICGPAGQQTWRGRPLKNDDPRTLAFHPPKEQFETPELRMDGRGMREWPEFIDTHMKHTIQVITFNDNALTEIPHNVDQLRSLTRLEIRNNKLAHLPATLGMMGRLAHLDLRGNPLNQQDPVLAALRGKSGLEVLL